AIEAGLNGLQSVDGVLGAGQIRRDPIRNDLPRHRALGVLLRDAHQALDCLARVADADATRRGGLRWCLLRSRIGLPRARRGLGLRGGGRGLGPLGAWPAASRVGLALSLLLDLRALHLWRLGGERGRRTNGHTPLPDSLRQFGHAPFNYLGGVVDGLAADADE